MKNCSNPLILILGLSVIVACNESGNHQVKTVEKHRPHYHFTPDSMWMNDPNGMFFLDSTYHLFYQYYPDSTVWGPMHWGHATSKDLVDWKHENIALYPDSLGWIFSGSAVVDTRNTSGFAKNNEVPVVAIFTHHSQPKEKEGRIDFQYQSIAYSLDGGKTFTKYENNPVLKNPGIRDFRDPKVFWNEESKSWVMILAAQSKVMIYTSPNLKEWTYASEFGSDLGAHGGVWECPDLFTLPISGENTKKWVMLVSINPGAPNGGSGTQYFIGDFDGKNFTIDETFQRNVLNGNGIWLDYGRDNYAGVTWSNANQPDDSKIFIGWMSNWDYAQQVPTQKWRSAMTLARNLHLVKSEKEGYLVTSKTFNGIEKYKEIKGKFNSAGSGSFTTIFQNQQHGFMSMKGNSLSTGFIHFYNTKNDTLTLEITPNQYILHRNDSKSVSQFHKNFAGKQVAPRHALNSSFDFEIYIDQSSVEIFADGGKTVMTSLYFFDEPIISVGMEAKDVKISEGLYGYIKK